MRSLAISLLLLTLSACIEVAEPAGPPKEAAFTGTVGPKTLSAVSARVMPIARQQCAARTEGIRCDFQLILDSRDGQPPNAFQSKSKEGQPRLTVNVALLNDLRNADELAFILGHEAAHHIRNHLDKMNSSATTGAVLGGLMAVVLGADPMTVDSATQAGAMVGSRSFSKRFELEADALGTIIAERAGYNAVRGAAYFTRIADPGNTFLGTHPPNADRIETVRKTAAAM